LRHIQVLKETRVLSKHTDHTLRSFISWEVATLIVKADDITYAGDGLREMEAEVLESEFEIENLGQQEIISCSGRCIVQYKY